MPAKIYTCPICGNTVSKRKSLSHPNYPDRICKSHEDAIKYSEYTSAITKNERQKSLEKDQALIKR